MHRNAFTVLEIQKGRNRKKINITISTKNLRIYRDKAENNKWKNHDSFPGKKQCGMYTVQLDYLLV